MEKTATEYFNEEIEQGKLLNTVQEALDALKRRKIEKGKLIDQLRAEIKDTEIEMLPLLDKIRKAKHNMAEARAKGFQARNSGL